MKPALVLVAVALLLVSLTPTAVIAKSSSIEITPFRLERHMVYEGVGYLYFRIPPGREQAARRDWTTGDKDFDLDFDKIAAQLQEASRH